MKTFYLFIVPLPFIIYSCSTPAYIPNFPQAPLFKKSNELKISASYGLPYTEAKASYSFTDHLFAFGGAAFSKKDSALNISKRIFEGGIGYYNYLYPPFHIPFIININHIEVLAGYSSGYSFGTFTGIDSFSVNMPADLRRYYIQINTGLSGEKFNELLNINMSAAFGHAIRFSYVDFFKFYIDGKSINKHLSNLFFEYFVFSKLGTDLFKFELSAGLVGPMQKKVDFTTSWFMVISLGASLNFSL